MFLLLKSSKSIFPVPGRRYLKSKDLLYIYYTFPNFRNLKLRFRTTPTTSDSILGSSVLVFDAVLDAIETVMSIFRCLIFEKAPRVDSNPRATSAFCLRASGSGGYHSANAAVAV